ncbi:MAG: hypothetical protein AAF944_23675 [Bacteroidota bacterium]
MEQKSLILMVLFVFCLTTLEAQSEDAIEGHWQDAAHPDKKVEIYAKNGKYHGKDPNDASTLVFKDLQWNGSSNTYSGFVINPDNGDALEVEIEMVDQNSFQFSVGPFIFKKTFRFTRI